MREKLSLAKERDENMDSILESLGRGLAVVKAVEDDLTCILERFKRSQEIMKGTVKKCVLN